jgi:hypothetical protein
VLDVLPGSPPLEVPGSDPDELPPPSEVPVPADVPEPEGSTGSVVEPPDEIESRPSVSVDAAGDVSPHAVRRRGTRATETGQGRRRIALSDTA